MSNLVTWLRPLTLPHPIPDILAYGIEPSHNYYISRTMHNLTPTIPSSPSYESYCRLLNMCIVTCFFFFFFFENVNTECLQKFTTGIYKIVSEESHVMNKHSTRLLSYTCTLYEYRYIKSIVSKSYPKLILFWFLFSL